MEPMAGSDAFQSLAARHASAGGDALGGGAGGKTGAREKWVGPRDPEEESESQGRT